MEFSYNYTSIMERFALPANLPAYVVTDCQSASYITPIYLHFKVNKNGGETPVLCYTEARDLFSKVKECAAQHPDKYGPKDFVEGVVPLCYDNYKVAAGADTIIKYFVDRRSRLNKVITPKGEVYYGAHGMVFDKNFKPILMATRIITEEMDDEETIIHVAPSVFLDEGIVNKAVLKKAVAFYMLHPVGYWGQQKMAKVIIDDCSKFISIPNSPTPNTDIKEDINNLLHEKLAEILDQMKYDSQYF